MAILFNLVQSAQLRLRVVSGEKKASDISSKRTIQNVFVCENEGEVRFCMHSLYLNLFYTHARTDAHTHIVWVIMHIFVGTPQRDLGNMSCIFENVLRLRLWSHIKTN